MTTLNMEEIDKTNFKCFLLPDDSIYFGEVVWIDQKNRITGFLISFFKDLFL